MKRFISSLLAGLVSFGTVAAMADGPDFIGGQLTLNTSTLRKDFQTSLPTPMDSMPITIKKGDKDSLSVALICHQRESSGDCKVLQAVTLYKGGTYKLSEPFAYISDAELKAYLKTDAAYSHFLMSNHYFNEMFSTTKGMTFWAFRVALAYGPTGILIAIPVALGGVVLGPPIDILKSPIVGINRLVREKRVKKGVEVLFTEGAERKADAKTFRAVSNALRTPVK